MNTLSLILPVHNEAEHLERSVRAIAHELTGAGMQLEFVLVDDGSTDGSWERIRTLSSDRSFTVRGVALSRNFGKEQAIHAGLSASTGDLAVVMDADLQHPPDTVLMMLDKHRETGCAVVHGIKRGRQHESGSTLPVRLFYACYRTATGFSLAGHTDFKLLTRPVIDAYVTLPERDRFFRGLIPWLGFSQETVPFTIAARTGGTTKWTGTKRLLLGLGAIRSFSALPLQLVTLAGSLFLLGAVGLTAYTLYEWWNGTAVEGFTTIIILQLVTSSVLMISLGIIGQYLAEIFSEIKARPAYLVRDTINPHDS